MKMKTKRQGLSTFFRMALVLAVNLYLFATCTTESDKADRSPTNEADSGNRREVLLSFKNKLTVKTTQTETKADTPIATEAENEIVTLDVYVFGAKAEGDAYTFRERFSYRQDGAALPAGAKELNLTPSTDNATTTALLELQKGLFVRLYCIANQTELINPVDEGPVADTYFTPLTYDTETGVLTDGIPTELQFQKFHSPLLTDASPALGLPLPMAGAQTTPIDLTDFGSSARVQVGFKLNRTMARFDVSNIEAESKFHIESISMGNGRKGTSFFPVKVYGAATAADGELITYPARAFEGDKANTGLQVSAFYSYPSPLNDNGYLILSGTYQVNQTETKEVSYKIPFKQQTADGNSIELAINANHRYTIGITKADEYHLDFTLDVAEWEEGGNLDDYDPNATGEAGEITITIPESFKGETQYDKDTRTVSMSLKAGSKFEIETQSSATLTLQKKYVGGISAQQYDWLEISEAETSLVSKAGQTNYKYTVSVKDGYDKTRFPRAVVRLTNIIDASETALVIEAESSLHISEVPQDAGNRNTFDFNSLTASLYRVTGSKVKVNVACADGSVAILPDWLEAKAVAANASVVTYELSLKEGSRDVEVTGNEGEVVFQNAKDNTKNTAITVKLLDASIVANFDALGGTGNVYEAPHDAVLGNIHMPLSPGNNFTVSTTSLDGVKIKMDFGTGPAWLSHDGPAASAKAGDMPNTIIFSPIADKAGEGKAQPVTVTLQNVSGGADHKFTVTPGYLAPSLTSPASVTLHAAADHNIPSITITGTNNLGGTILEGPEWLTYSETNTGTGNFSYTVKLDPSQTDFPTSVPADETIRLINKAVPDKSTMVTVSFTDDVWIADDFANYDEKTSEGYRVGTGKKTMTVSFYSMFAFAFSPDYNNPYCNSKNGGNTWLNNSKLVNTEVVNNRRKYTFNVEVDAASGTDAAYQLHKATLQLKQNSTTVKSYTIWRGASYVGYPMGSGSASPYYTAIKKGTYYWAPVNCGATRVAQARDGKNMTVAGTGNLYQWGRYEATNHGGPTANGPTGSTRPGNNFYKAPNDPYNWLNTLNNSLWNGSSKGTNDPCPPGYRVPTFDEFWSIGNATSWDGSGGLFIVNAESGYPQLVLPAAGFRSGYDGSSYRQGSLGYYWSSSVPSGNTYTRYVSFNSATFSQGTNYRAYGYSVRCIRQ